MSLLQKLNEIEQLDKLSMDLMDTDEDASDKAYSEMWALVNEVAAEIQKITSGQIDNNLAKRMVFHQRDKLMALCASARM